MFSEPVHDRVLLLDRCELIPVERYVSALPQDSQTGHSASGRRKGRCTVQYLLPLFHLFAAIRSFTASSGANKDLSFPTRVLPSLVSFGAELSNSLLARAF